MIEHAYIHIPFCIRKCKYCSFVSGFDINNKQQYINALISEIKKKYNNDNLKTIYIGGGTPSLLEKSDIELVLSLLKFNKETEITLEANPETVESVKFKTFKETGINRISLGVQTFNDSLLEKIGRLHTKKDILNAVEIIKSADFNNISIDLIYGLPNQTLKDFIIDIEQALKLGIQHISTYGLKIEENSYFSKNIPKNLPDDELQAEMYLKICDLLKKAGFIHYEISNFAKSGYNSQHNTAYWLNKNYYGFGLNASGYEGNIRYKNTSQMAEYINNPTTLEEKNILSKQETMENSIFLALRLAKGIDISDFNQKYDFDFINTYKKIIEKYSNLDLLKISDNRIFLTEKGFLLSNEIMSEFL